MNAGELTFTCKFTKTNTAGIEVTEVAALTTTAETATHYPRTEFRFLL